MGIKSSFNKFLKNIDESIFKLTHISEFEFKKVAIDVTLFIYKYKVSNGKNWLNQFVDLICVLRKNNIHPYFVFDGEYPLEKENEQKKRRQLRENKKQYIMKLESALDEYKKSGYVDKLLLKFRQSYLNPHIINIEKVQELIDLKKKQLINIRTNDMIILKELFSVLQIGWCVAPEESEKFCSWLTLNGKADAVMSDDSDVIAYGTPLILTKMNTWSESVVCLKFNHVLKSLAFSSLEQFLDFCIMCGTDYNPNIYKVGSVSAHKLISQYKCIENIKKHTKLDTSVLNFITVRSLFREFNNYPEDIKVPYCKIPNWQHVETLFNKYNIKPLTVENKQYFEFNPVILDFVDNL